jgi:hypothetical protein
VLADQIAEPASWRAVPVLDSGETAYVFTSPPDGWFQDWQAARRALPKTGRWPIAVTFWGGPDDDELFSRARRATAPTFPMTNTWRTCSVRRRSGSAPPRA